MKLRAAVNNYLILELWTWAHLCTKLSNTPTVNTSSNGNIWSGSVGPYCLLKFCLSRLMTKPSKWHVRPVKTQISLGIRPVWSVSSLSAWRKLGSLATHWVHSEDSDQTGQMPRLIWVFAGRTDHFVGFVMRRLICPNSPDHYSVVMISEWGFNNGWRSCTHKEKEEVKFSPEQK